MVRGLALKPAETRSEQPYPMPPAHAKTAPDAKYRPILAYHVNFCGIGNRALTPYRPRGHTRQ
jgi:hypothetical protein